MNREDYKILIQQTKLNQLRQTNTANKCSAITLAIKSAIAHCITNMLDYQLQLDNLSDFVHTKQSLEKNFKMQGEGTMDDPFKITTNYGAGEFYNAHFLFLNCEYPKFVRPNNCHTNSYKFAKMYLDKCEVLFGICQTDHSFLHSIVKVKDFIVDFNYNLVMSADLYFSLFNFEVLNTISNEDIKNNNKQLIDAITKNNILITDGEVNACFYELLDLIKTNEFTN